MLNSPLFANGVTLATAAHLSESSLGHRRSSFEVCLGSLPTRWGFAIFAGVEQLAKDLETASPSREEIEHAVALGVIPRGFDERLKRSALCVDMDAPDEGTTLFQGDPIATIEGPLWQAWLVAHSIASWLSLPMTVATRAARLRLVAGAIGVLDGSSVSLVDRLAAMSVARAAHIGGSSACLHVPAAERLGIPFHAQKDPRIAQLADTGRESPDGGWDLQTTAKGIAFDLGPGDDEEETLLELQREGLAMGHWVSSGLCQPAAELVLRTDLVALEESGSWVSRLGVVPDLTVVPGRKIIVRYADQAGQAIADVKHGIAERIQPPAKALVVGPMGAGAATPILGAASATPLLKPLLRNSLRVGRDDGWKSARQRALRELDSLAFAYARIRHPARYPVGLSPELAYRKAELIGRLTVA